MLEGHAGRLRLFLLAPCLIPLAALAYLINKYGVNLPFSDQWEFVKLIEKSRSSGVTLSDLFSQHGEQRMFFPRLVMLIVAPLTRWNVRVEMFIALLLAVGMFLVLFFMLRRTLAFMGLWIAGPLFALSVMLFSPVQWENWLWGWQLSWFLPLAALLVATGLLTVWPEMRSPWPALVLAAIAAVVGQYSLSSGSLIWIVCIPILFVRPFMRKLIPVWLLLAVAFTAALFVGYKSPPELEKAHSSIPEMVSNPRATSEYFFYLLSRPVLDDKPGYLLGATVLVGFIALVSVALVRKRDRLDRAVFWVALGGYAAGAAAITTVGRMGLGLQFAGSSRYTTLGILLTISTLALAGVVLGPNDSTSTEGGPELAALDRPSRKQPVRRAVPAIAAAWLLAAALFVVDYPSEVSSMKVWHRERLSIRACLISATSPHQACLTKAYPVRPVIYERARYLQSIGWAGFEP